MDRMDKITARSIILFKASKDHQGKDPYIQILEDNGYSAVCLNVLGFSFCNLNQLQDFLLQADNFSGIIFTSQRTVEAVHKAMDQTGSANWKENWQKKAVYVVGKATSDEVRKLGLVPKGENTGNAQELAKMITSDGVKPPEPLLFPCGNLRKDTLPQHLANAGIQLKEIMVYETSQNTSIHDELEDYFKSKGFPEYIVYFSPSGVQFTNDILKKLHFPMASIQCVAIGPSTREALLEHGLTVFSTASKPTPEALLGALSKPDTSV